MLCFVWVSILFLFSLWAWVCKSGQNLWQETPRSINETDSSLKLQRSRKAKKTLRIKTNGRFCECFVHVKHHFYSDDKCFRKMKKDWIVDDYSKAVIGSGFVSAWSHYSAKHEIVWNFSADPVWVEVQSSDVIGRSVDCNFSKRHQSLLKVDLVSQSYLKS